ncbi:MAG: DUF6675 family protein [Spirochaetales bacterium]
MIELKLHPTFKLRLFLWIILTSFFPGKVLSAQGVRLPAQTLVQAFPALTAEELTLLHTEGEITRYYFEPVLPKWMPREGLGAILLQEAQTLPAVIGVESMHLLRYEEARGILQPDSIFTDGKVSWVQVYNILLSLRSMKGIEYYSASRGRMRTLFAESYVIKSAEDPTPLPDPKVSDLPPEQILYVFQEDLTFGKNITRWKYRTQEEGVAISITNLTPMRYSFFTVADPGNMQIHLLVSPTEEGIVFYGCMVAKSPRFLGLEKTRTESFYNRIKALFSWFKREAGKEKIGG